MILRDAHQSGRFDATPQQRARMLSNLADHAGVGVVTEGVGLEPLDGWATVGNETKILWDTTRWARLADGTEAIDTPEWRRGRSRRTQVDIEWVLLQHIRTGLKVLRLGGHLPAHLFLPSQRRANEAALNALGPLILQLQQQNAPDVTTTSFDLNRDMRRKSQRRLVEQAFACVDNLHLIIPPHGTHGRRKIDALATTAPLARARMLPRARGFDHHGFATAACACPPAKGR